jgi:tetratricopeptide (TPR) repeat protein
MPALVDRLIDIRRSSVLPRVTNDFTQEVWAATCAVLADIDHVTCVVDGLDELVVAESTQLLQEMEELARNMKSKGMKFRCLVTSRTPKHLVSTSWRLRRLQTQDFCQDIEIAIDHWLSQSKEFAKYSSSQRKRIASKIQSSAEGMFLWAELVLQDILNQPSLERVLNKTETLPSGLSSTYQGLLNQLDLEDEDVLRILKWTLCANRPVSLLELEAALSTEIGEDELTTRITTVEHDIQRKCGPFISIRNGFSTITHLSATQFLLFDALTAKIQLTRPYCHREIALRCLTYLTLPFETLPAMVELFAETRDSTRQLFSQISIDHSLMQYASHHWVYHLQHSNILAGSQCTDELDLHSILELRDILSNSQPIAWMENVDISQPTDLGKALEQQKLSLRIRELILGSSHTEVIQNTSNLARVHEACGNHLKAAMLYQRCWEYCKDNFAVCWQAAFEFADKLVNSMEMAGRGAETIEVASWIWQTRSEMLGSVAEATLAAAHKLSWTYLRIEMHGEALSMDREIYAVTLKELGPLHSQTRQAADTLIKTLQLCSKVEEILPISRRAWKAINDVTAADPEMMMSILLDLTHALEKCNKSKEAEELLRQILGQDCSDSVERKRIELQVSLELAKVLRRQGQDERSLVVLKETWSLNKQRISRHNQLDEPLLRHFEALAAEFVNSEVINEASDVLSVLLQYKRIVKGRGSLSTIMAASELAKVLIRRTLRKKAEEVLRHCFDECLQSIPSTDSAFVAGENLALQYQARERWLAAAATWKRVLASLWSGFGTNTSPVLPSSSREICIDTACRYAMCLSKHGLVHRAEHVYGKLYKTCQSQLGFDNTATLSVMKEMGGFLRGVDSLQAMESTYARYYEKCLIEYPESDLRTYNAGKQLGEAIRSIKPPNLQPSTLEKAERLYKELLNIAKTRWGEDHDEASYLSLALADILGKDEKHRLRQKKLQKVWTNIYNQLVSVTELDAGEIERSGHSIQTVQEAHHELMGIYKGQINTTSAKLQESQFLEVLVQIRRTQPTMTPKIAQIMAEEGLVGSATSLYVEMILQDENGNELWALLQKLSYLLNRNTAVVFDPRLLEILKQNVMEDRSLSDSRQSIILRVLRAHNSKEAFKIAFKLIQNEQAKVGYEEHKLPDLDGSGCESISRSAQIHLLRLYLMRNNEASLELAFQYLEDERDIIKHELTARHSDVGRRRMENKRIDAEQMALDKLLRNLLDVDGEGSLDNVCQVLYSELKRDSGSTIVPKHILIEQFAEKCISTRRFDLIRGLYQASSKQKQSPLARSEAEFLTISLAKVCVEVDDMAELTGVWEKIKDRPSSELCITITKLLARTHSVKNRKQELLSILIEFDRAYRYEHCWNGSLRTIRRETLRRICPIPAVEANDELVIVNAVQIIDEFNNTDEFRLLVLAILWIYAENNQGSEIPEYNPYHMHFLTPSIVKKALEKSYKVVRNDLAKAHDIVGIGGNSALLVLLLDISSGELSTASTQEFEDILSSKTAATLIQCVISLSMKSTQPFFDKKLRLALDTARLILQFRVDAGDLSFINLHSDTEYIREKYMLQALQQESVMNGSLIHLVLKQESCPLPVLQRLYEIASASDALEHPNFSSSLGFGTATSNQHIGIDSERLKIRYQITLHVLEQNESSPLQQSALGLLERSFYLCREGLPLDTPLTYRILKDMVKWFKRSHSQKVFALTEIYQRIWNDTASISRWTTPALSDIGILVSLETFIDGQREKAIDMAQMIASNDEIAFGWTAQTYNSYNVLSYYYAASGSYNKVFTLHSRILPIAKKNSRGMGLNRHVHEQTNLLGRALENLGRWREAESMYRELWRMCSAIGPNHWMLRKPGNIASWQELQKALRTLSERFMLEGMRSLNSPHTDHRGGLEAYLAGGDGQKAGFWEYCW